LSKDRDGKSQGLKGRRVGEKAGRAQCFLSSNPGSEKKMTKTWEEKRVNAEVEVGECL